MKFTRFRTGAMVPCVMLFTIAALLIWRGDTCAAVGIAGIIGLVGTTFADKREDAVRAAERPGLERR